QAFFQQAAGSGIVQVFLQLPALFISAGVEDRFQRHAGCLLRQVDIFFHRNYRLIGAGATRMTSSIVVTPAATFWAPLSRNVRMPSFMPWPRMAARSHSLMTYFCTSVLIGRIS